MKVFYKKDYLNLKDEYAILFDIYERTKNDLFEMVKKNKAINKQVDDLANLLMLDKEAQMSLEALNEDLKAKLKECRGAKGGLTNKVHRLEKEIEELNAKLSDTENKLKESMTGKYLVKKVKAGRTPKTQTIGLKSGYIEGKIAGELKKEEN